MSEPVRLSVVVVTHDSRSAVEHALGALVAQLAPGDELIVVDNASRDGSVEAVRALAPGARVIRNAGNAGFAAGANAGAAAATGDLLVLLNPDARPLDGFAEGIRRPLARGYGWDAWQALVVSGDQVNTSGGVVHFTGIAWAGEAGRPVPGSLHAPSDVGFASGACLAVPLAVWRRLGGFAEHFFMYHEDVDLALRIRLAGGRVGAEPAARVDHDYAFAKGAPKWRRLERNRWATIVRTYPAPLLVALAPALLATEVALWAVALAGGWGPAKAQAVGDVLRALPALLRERRAVQASARVSAGAFAGGLVAGLDSPFLGRVGSLPALRLLLGAYWAAVRLGLGALRS